MNSEKSHQTSFWADAWARHMEEYLAAPPRCGIWLRSYFGKKTNSFHECAGGSCRDSRYLFEIGFAATGSDCDEKTLNYVNSKFKNSNFTTDKRDAFSLDFDSKTFDIVFHNGFWVYFRDDEKLIDLFREQCRVSKRHAVVLVHNIRNKRLVHNFYEKSRNDDLYDIRFFDCSTLIRIIQRSQVKYIRYRLIKFGGVIDRLYVVETKLPLMTPIVRWLVPRLYKFQPWSMVERIALIVDLDSEAAQ